MEKEPATASRSQSVQYEFLAVSEEKPGSRKLVLCIGDCKSTGAARLRGGDTRNLCLVGPVPYNVKNQEV